MSPHKTSAITLTPPKSTPHALSKPSPTESNKKRKKKEDHLIATETGPDDTGTGFKRSTKRAKLALHDNDSAFSALVTKSKPEKREKTKGDKDPMPEVIETKGEKRVAKGKKSKKKQTNKPVVSEDEGEGDDEEVDDKNQNPSSSDSEEDGGEYVPPVHESLAGGPGANSAPPSKKSRKYVPPDETPGQRDSRTIFVGNVPSQVMTTKVS